MLPEVVEKHAVLELRAELNRALRAVVHTESNDGESNDGESNDGESNDGESNDSASGAGASKYGASNIGAIAGPSVVTVDCSRVQRLSAAAAGALISARRRARGQRLDVVLHQPSEACVIALHEYRLGHLLPGLPRPPRPERRSRGFDDDD